MKRTFGYTWLIGASVAIATTVPAAAKSPVVSLSDSIEPLRKQFNAVKARPRVVALLSPTSKAGMDGSDALAASLLSGAISNGPEVIIVWVNLLHGDTPDAADRAAARFAGSRATQFYDAKGRAAWSFGAATLGEQRKGVWNTYVYYLAGAMWSTDPPRPEDWLHEMAGPRAVDPLRFRGGMKLRAGLRRWLSDSGSSVDLPTEPVGYTVGAVIVDSPPAPVARPRRVPKAPPPSIPPMSHDDYNGPFEDRGTPVSSTGADTWAQPTKSCSKSTARPTTLGSFESSISPNSTNTTRSARSVMPSPVSPSTTASSRNWPKEPARPNWTNSSSASTVANRSTLPTSNGNLLPLEPLPNDRGSVAVNRAQPPAPVSSARASGPAGFTLSATVDTPVGGKATVKSKSTAPV